MLEINSWNETDPLRSIIIGDPTNSYQVPKEFPTKIKSLNQCHNKVPFSKLDIDAAKKQINNLINILQNEYSVKVIRPDIINHSNSITTPYWNITNTNENTCPRDTFSILGNTILEAPMSWRCRYFESSVYHQPLLKLWNLDNNCRWVQPPKPLMTDNLYNELFPLDISSRKPFINNYQYILNETEIVFDAADIIRCGKDLFMQKGYTTNDMGIDWVKREFGNQFRIHKTLLENNESSTHLDAEMCILRPGLLLTCPDRPLENNLLQQIKNEDNDWDVVDAPAPYVYNMPEGCYSSPWLSINMLSIDENTIMIEEKETSLITMLENEYGFNVIPIPFRDCYKFGGGLHCQSLDLYRDGNKQSYFPYFDILDERNTVS